MRVLLIDGFDGDDPVVATARAVLEALGHEVELIDLAAQDFTVAMSTAERRAYHDEGRNLLADDARAGAAALGRADALLVCCPVVAHSLPARTKAFLDRVCIPGVAFTLADGTFRPRLRHIRQLGLVTRSPHRRRATARARDGAHRSVLWTIRLNCAWTCRRTRVRLGPVGGEAAVVRALRGW